MEPPSPRIEIDAGIVAAGLGIDSRAFQALMGEGQVSTLCERGVGADAGLHRVTFYYGRRRFRVLVDFAGNVIGQG